MTTAAAGAAHFSGGWADASVLVLAGAAAGYCAAAASGNAAPPPRRRPAIPLLEPELETEDARATTAASAASGPTSARREWLAQQWLRHRKQRRLPLGSPTPVPPTAVAGVAAEFQRLSIGGCCLDEYATTLPSSVRRQVVCADALEWLRGDDCVGGAAGSSSCLLPGHVVTGLPDISEIQQCDTVAQYSEWFRSTVTLILSRLAPRAVLVLCQSDGRHNGAWLDKSHLAQTAAESAVR